MFIALGLAMIIAVGQIAPSLAFGTVTNFATDGDTQTAYLFAAILAVIGVLVGVGTKYFRIFGQQFNQSVVVPAPSSGLLPVEQARRELLRP